MGIVVVDFYMSGTEESHVRLEMMYRQAILTSGKLPMNISI